jgi:hypothetical protein
LVADAVKVTAVPEQTVLPGAAEMETSGVTTGLTFIVMLFEVAGLFVTHASVEVITHFTTSLFDREALE